MSFNLLIDVLMDKYYECVVEVVLWGLTKQRFFRANWAAELFQAGC